MKKIMGTIFLTQLAFGLMGCGSSSVTKSSSSSPSTIQEAAVHSTIAQIHTQALSTGQDAVNAASGSGSTASIDQIIQQVQQTFSDFMTQLQNLNIQGADPQTQDQLNQEMQQFSQQLQSELDQLVSQLQQMAQSFPSQTSQSSTSGGSGAGSIPNLFSGGDLGLGNFQFPSMPGAQSGTCSTGSCSGNQAITVKSP